MDITSAIQQKVDNVILLLRAIEPYPSGHSKPLNHLEVDVCLCVYSEVGGRLIYWENKWVDRGGGGQWKQAEE